jgi:hypothetical protein
LNQQEKLKDFIYPISADDTNAAVCSGNLKAMRSERESCYAPDVRHGEKANKSMSEQHQTLFASRSSDATTISGGSKNLKAVHFFESQAFPFT